jgi:hypothetical protein
MFPGSVNQMLTFGIWDNVVYSGDAAATMTAVHVVPTGGAYVKVDVHGGTANSGTVNVAGNVSGAATNEDLVYNGARWKISVNRFDAGSLVITSSGLANETVKPTVVVTSVDSAGNPVQWTTTKVVPARFREVKRFGINYLATVKQGGMITPWIHEVYLAGYPTWLKEGMEFSVRKLRANYRIDGQIVPHQQQGTDLVDFVHFFCVKVNDGA